MKSLQVKILAVILAELFDEVTSTTSAEEFLEKMTIFSEYRLKIKTINKTVKHTQIDIVFNMIVSPFTFKPCKYLHILLLGSELEMPECTCGIDKKEAEDKDFKMAMLSMKDILAMLQKHSK